MSEMEDKLGAILNNPQMMQQIMSIAQNLGRQPQQPEPPGEQQGSPLPDAAMLQKLAGVVSSSGADSQQKALLNALSPYVHRDKLQRLERAMRAAKMAQLASSFLGSGALQALTGR